MYEAQIQERMRRRRRANRFVDKINMIIKDII